MAPPPTPAPRVFVSSTFSDLVEHRAALLEGIRMLGYTDVAMEHFVPEDLGLVAKCEKDVRTCQVYVGLVAWRYGTRPVHDNPGRLSITEIEQRAAVAAGLQRFYFLHDPECAWVMKLVEDHADVVAFRKRIADDRPPSLFKSVDDLRGVVITALSGLRDANPLPAYLAQLVNTIEQEPLALDDLYFDTRTLDAVYVEVHADSKDAELMLRGHERGDWKQGQTIDHFLELKEKRCFALLGEPGSGKSTLVAKVAADRGRLALDKLKKKEELDKAGIPVRVRLSDLGSAGAVDIIAFAAAGSEAGLDRALRDAATRGELLFLLDGLDEVKPDERERVMSAIKALAAQRAWLDAGCRLIVTSRPFGYKPPANVFMLLALVPLDLDKQRALLTAWLSGRDGSVAHVGAILKAIAKERSLRELAGNPLMLTLMALLALDDLREHKVVRLPKGRAALLKRAIHRLVADDGRRAVAHRDEVIEVLEDAALHLLRHGAGPYDRAHTKKALARSDGFEQLCKMETAWRDPAVLLKEVVGKSGLLVMVGGDRCRFVHRALQERLAASALGRLGREKWEPLVAKVRKDPETLGAWAETFALLVDELEDANTLLQDLARVNPDLAVRALGSAAEGSVTSETLLLLVKMEGDRDKWEERGKVIEGLLEQLGKTATAVGILQKIRPTLRHGADLFFVRDALLSIEDGGDEQAKRSARDELERLFEHLDTPPVLTDVELPGGERESYWCEVPYPAGPFALARVLVTNALYERFDPGHGAERYSGNDNRGVDFDHHPVGNVSLFEAVMFCMWLAQSNPGVVLPTAEQWEFAATKGDGREYPWGDEEDHSTRRVYMGEGPRRVGSRPLGAGPFGNLDLLGNVAEWTLDANDISDKNVDKTSCRSVRGALHTPFSKLNAKSTEDDHPSVRYPYLGFRCAQLRRPSTA